MVRRILLLLRARLSGAGADAGVPWATILSHALIAAALCGLVAEGLPPFAYGVFALSLSAALIAIPLLGDLAPLLEADEAADWLASLPARPVERRIARSLHALLTLWVLALGSLLPAAALAPSAADLAPRLALPALGLGLAALLAAALLLARAVLGGRAETLLVLLQTLLVVGVVVGLTTGVRYAPRLAMLPTLGDEHALFLRCFPPAWFAAPLASAEGEPARWWLPLLAGAGALGMLVALPPAARLQREAGEPLLAMVLRPARALARRFWLRVDERGPFDLVYDALPREREVVLRTYPMIGIPLAFLVVAATGEEGAARDGLLALILFSAGVYLPILLMQVPSSKSANACWLLSTAPVSPAAVDSGALKALSLRFLLPLYVALAALAAVWSGPAAVLRLALPGLLTSHLVLRALYRRLVTAPPLSVPPDELEGSPDWTGTLFGLAFVLTFVAILANVWLTTVPRGLAASLVLIGLELTFGRRRR
jgi:hypothetical protein